MSNSLLKYNIKEIEYLEVSNQVELTLVDSNKILIDLMNDLDINL